MLKVYNLTNVSGSQKNTTVEADSNKRFGQLRWSPDSKQFFVVSEAYKSGEGCESAFFAEETFTYDPASKQYKKSIQNKADLIGAWYPGEPDVQIKFGQSTESPTSLYVNGFLAEKGDRHPQSFIYVGYLN